MPSIEQQQQLQHDSCIQRFATAAGASLAAPMQARSPARPNHNKAPRSAALALKQQQQPKNITTTSANRIERRLLFRPNERYSCSNQRAVQQQKQQYLLQSQEQRQQQQQHRHYHTTRAANKRVVDFEVETPVDYSILVRSSHGDLVVLRRTKFEERTSTDGTFLPKSLDSSLTQHSQPALSVRQEQILL